MTVQRIKMNGRPMGVYSEYLEKNFDFAALVAERKKQLKRIATIRGRDVLVVAADLSKQGAPISINYSDILPITDQIENLTGKGLDLVLETPGGQGEVAEDIIRILRQKYETLAVIIPGYAKSAGTIMTMAADEILMGEGSALGPIDAQISSQGKVFSAEAFLEGMEKIKREVTQTGTLNKAYIPVLQSISPGELQAAENALNFAKVLVTEWLAKFKFKTWTKHSSTGVDVTPEERTKQAQSIAKQLCNHSRWLTHGRSLGRERLEEMGLKITTYGKDDLGDAIRRYYTLLQMTFATNIYKIFETPDSQIMRFIAPQTPPPGGGPAASADVAFFDVKCGKCVQVTKVQANLGKPAPLQSGCVPFPKNNSLACPNCGMVTDIGDARRQLEAQTKKPVVL
jgi:hypothetical protein